MSQWLHRRLLAGAIALDLAAPAWAQSTGIIAGRVIDRQTAARPWQRAGPHPRYDARRSRPTSPAPTAS